MKENALVCWVSSINLNTYFFLIQFLFWIGINGAGKTTFFSMLVGDLEPTDGTAYIKNINLIDNLKQFQQQIGYCPQFDALLDNLTGEEMLFLFGRLRGIKEKNLKRTVDCIIKMVDLVDHSKFICSAYSGGNKRKLSLGMALIGLPRIIFLDGNLISII